jgi:hypothetical protein
LLRNQPHSTSHIHKIKHKIQAWQQHCSRTLPVKILTEVSRKEHCRTDH